MEPKGGMFKVNRTGPRMDPWRTAHVRGVEEDDSLNVTQKLLPVRYIPFELFFQTSFDIIVDPCVLLINGL